jgi:DtxR family Mn-dependent transcriptional regulator
MPTAAPRLVEHTSSQTVSRYLETIFYIAAEGEAVRASRLAEWLGVSQPTVGATLQRMIRDGLVSISPTKEVNLTPDGAAEAARVVRRHRIAERWLTDVLGLDWLQADEEAGRLEHALSDELADRLYEHIGRPLTCPHGNPIPGGPATTVGERALRSLQGGDVATVRRVSEVAEHETPELLRFLSSSGLGLGVGVTCLSVDPGAGILTVAVGDRQVPMSLEVAGRIWVD